MKLLNKFLFLLFFFIPPAFAGGMRFMTIADIHFDPFIACQKVVPCPLIKKLENAPMNAWPVILEANDRNPPQYKQDTNYVLLKASLQTAKEVAASQHVQFVIVLGDFLGHEFKLHYRKYTRDYSQNHYQLFVKKTLLFLNNELKQAFPNKNIYAVVGNNDTYYRNYYSEANSQFYQETALLWSHLIQNNHAREIMQDDFEANGYYAFDLPDDPSLRFIVLNSVLFSYKAKGKRVDLEALKELNWLHEELEIAKERRQKVLIAMHIPPGLDMFTFRLMDLWKTPYTKRFEAEIATFTPEVMGILAGHLHSDWKRGLMSGTQSISPFFGNDPGFKIYTYSTTTKNMVHEEAHSQSLSQIKMP